MYDATENPPTADEIVAGVQRLSDERAEYMERLHDVEIALLVMKRERDELRQELEEIQRDALRIFEMDVPSGRGWVYVQDAGVVAISPELDEATRARLLAQVKPPKLTTCGVCGAPMYPGTPCAMHG